MKRAKPIFIEVGFVTGPLNRRAAATLVVRPDLLRRLAYKAENSVHGRACVAGRGIELRLDSPNPLAREGPLGNVTWNYPAPPNEDLRGVQSPIPNPQSPIERQRSAAANRPT